MCWSETAGLVEGEHAVLFFALQEVIEVPDAPHGVTWIYLVEVST